MKKIAIITTHPIQYQIPLFKNFKKKILYAMFFLHQNMDLNQKKKIKN